MKNKQVRQMAKGAYPLIPNPAVTRSIAVAIANQSHRAKRF